MFRVIETFSGIGAQAKALERIGAEYSIENTCDWDINAIIAYCRIHNGGIATEVYAKVSDDDIVVIIGKQIKTRKESILEFEKGNREDLIDKTNEEIKILEQYMPEQLSEDEINNIIDEIITSINATSIKQMGLVMKEASSKLKGKADMKLVNNIIKSKLS